MRLRAYKLVYQNTREKSQIFHTTWANIGNSLKYKE